MDGLNFKCDPSIMEQFFERDSFGSFIPNPGKLRMDTAKSKLLRQLKADTGFYSRLATIYERTDVQFTDNPLGNTPTLGVGYKLFGKRPLNVKKGRRINRLEGKGQNLAKQLEKRQRKIFAVHEELMSVHSKLESTIDSDQKRLLWEVESDQVQTGGGFDNNQIGEVNKSALHFVSDSATSIDFRDSELSKVVVEGCLWVRQHLKEQGLVEGSIQPMGASFVRAEQDADGMFGFPVYAKGYDELDQDLAKRLLIETGVSTAHLVGSGVYDKAKGIHTGARVLDAGAYILDNKGIFSADDMVSLVTLLARIQKHGWKRDDSGQLIAKPGKTRSVYPNAFIPSLIEAMIMAPFNDKLKEIKFSGLPSLQDKPTRVEIIKQQIIDALRNGHDYLAADWSKYDASVKGAILATVVQLVVKPFVNARYHYWVDAATYILTYKYIICSTPLCELWPEEYNEAQQAAPSFRVKDYTVFGLVDGLISGAKFTHVGGSLYGLVTIHYGIPVLMGWEPIIGAQAGDDTLVGVPISAIDITSVSNTYDPIIETAERFGLHANASKQIWWNIRGEVVKVFLQDSYHAATDTWGVGSIFRPADAVWVSERDKGLSIAEQLMAEIARMNQGADSPFVEPVVEWWLSKERYLGWLFKEYGVSAFAKIVESIGQSIDDITKTIDVGSFTFGVDRQDLEAGTLPILDVCARVAAQMTFSSEDKADFVRDMDPENSDEISDTEFTLEFDDDDSIE